MTVEQIYRLAIELGIKHDIRGRAVVRRNLNRVRKTYDELPAKKRKYFDTDKFFNPYMDTRFFGDGRREVKRMLVGIDIGAGEVMLAHELSRQNPEHPINLIFSHHPQAKALTEGLADVMRVQIELLHTFGIPINIAESLTKQRLEEVAKSAHSKNFFQATDAAALLGYPLVCVHTPTDNMVATFMFKLIKRRARHLDTVGDIIDILLEIPEYQIAMERGNGPYIMVGNPDNYAGKIALTEITGGTENTPDTYEKLGHFGIGTVIGMHISEKHEEQAKKHHVNVVIAGHMASDSLGVNIFLDHLERRGIKIVPTSGFTRVSRIATRQGEKAPFRKRIRGTRKRA